MYRLQKIAVALQEETIITWGPARWELRWPARFLKLDSENQEVQTWKLSSSGIQTTQMHLNSFVSVQKPKQTSHVTLTAVRS